MIKMHKTPNNYVGKGLRLIAFTVVSVSLMAASCNRKSKHCEAYGKSLSISNPHMKMKNGQVATASAVDYLTNTPE